MEFNATFLVSAFSFILFTLIMNKILYQPVSEIIAKRQAYLDGNAKFAQENIDKASSIKKDKEEQVLSSRNEAKQLIMAEVEKSKMEKSEMEAQKRAEIMDKISSEKEGLYSEKEKVAAELNLQVEDISNSIIAKISGGHS